MKEVQDEKEEKTKKRKEKEEGWLKWWRGNRLEKCREDRKIVKNDAPRWTGRTDSYCFPTHFPNAGKLTELVSTDRFFPTYTAFRDAFFFRDLGSAEIGTR